VDAIGKPLNVGPLGATVEVTDEFFLLATGGSAASTGTVTKTGSHAGLNAGEQVTFVYDKCFFGDSDMVVDGTVQLTARSVVVPSATGGYSVSFDAVATGLTITYKGLAARYDGEVEVVSAISDPEADTISTRFAVPADRTFDIVLSAGEPTFSVSYGAGTTFASTSTESTRSASVKLDGTVAAGVAAGTGAVGSATGMVAMAIATPSALAGPPPTDLFVATSGVIVTRSIADDLSTSVTIVGDNLTVRGDTDRNGAPDLSFDTTWAGLITP